MSMEKHESSGGGSFKEMSADLDKASAMMTDKERELTDYREELSKLNSRSLIDSLVNQDGAVRKAQRGYDDERSRDGVQERENEEKWKPYITHREAMLRLVEDEMLKRLESKK